MPVQPLSPGVYLERLPSGVRAIAGVSTSVAAFVGEARRGAVGVPRRVFNFSDFERAFGGLSVDQELGYSVRQFFSNGGGEAWIVRVAADAATASRDLNDAAGTAVLTVSALDAGEFGNTIALAVNHDTRDPGATFNLSVIPLDDPAASESFTGLSMDSADPRYAPKLVSAKSSLVKVERKTGLSFEAAESRSGSISDVAASLGGPAPKTAIRVAVNGLAPIPVTIAAADFQGNDNGARLTSLATAIATKVKGGSTAPVVQSFTCTVDNDKLVLAMPASEQASVRVLPGERNDAAAALKLGVAGGGVEKSGSGARRPAALPGSGSITGAGLSNGALNATPAADVQAFNLVLDAGVAIKVDLGTAPAPGGNGAIAGKIDDVAARIQTAVRAARGTPAFKNFRATVIPGGGGTGPQLVLSSGTGGAGSSVAVTVAKLSNGTDDPLADKLGLLAGATSAEGKNATLESGDAKPITEATTYTSYAPAGGPGAPRGLYALDVVDGFNLLILPGVTDGATLAEAASYAEKRRAFLIVDGPPDADYEAMRAHAVSPALPKTINGAVYYPHIQVADPLRGGALRLSPPSGAIAGLYARTDVTRGVWKAPAGTDAGISGALGVSQPLTDDHNGVLNPIGVNCIRAFPVYGVVSWGARTLRGSNDEGNEYKYVPVSRLALFLEESLFRGLKWAVFEPNDETLWSQIRLNVGSFMHGLFRQGAFAGVSARDAYFVRCDAETTTPADADLGRVNVIVGFAPLKPCEFVVIQLQQIAGQASAA